MQRPPTWLGLAVIAAGFVVVPAVFALVLGLVLTVAAPTLQPKLAGLGLVAPVSAPQLITAPAQAEPTAAPAAFVIGAEAPPASARQLAVQIVEGSLSDPTSWGFDPRSLTARVGDTITWTNAGSLPHTITAEGGAFDSDVLRKGEQWSFTPSAAGTFNYLCALHPDMQGRLVVEGASQAPAPTEGAPDAAVAPAAEAPPASQPEEPASAPAAAEAPPTSAQARAGRQLSAQIVATGFNPTTITAVVGDTITWTNTDSRKHTATANDRAFDSGILATGAQWSWTAGRPGTFPYVCELHPEMQGTLVVTTEAGADAPASQPEASAPQAQAPAAAPAPQPTAAAPAPQPTAPPAPAPPPAGGQQHAAQIVAGGFNPATINAVVGETITWTNTDALKHTATADDGSFDSGILATGVQWSWTADRAGTFAYRCDLHPEMRGTLVVTTTAGGTAPSPVPTQPAATIQPTATLVQPTATSAPAPPGAGQQVSAQIVNGGFSPSTINAPVGATIVWTNVDGRKHTVTATDGSFNSGAVNPGAQWWWAANKAGSFSYFCDFHPEMRGTLVVALTAAPQPTATPGGASPQPTTAPTQAPQATATPVPTTTKAEISLAGSSAYPSASGRARYESSGTRRELRVELAGVSALKGATLDVFVGGSKVGSMAVDSNGNARLELRTDQGATTVPESVAGKKLEVKTGAGALVASGSF